MAKDDCGIGWNVMESSKDKVAATIKSEPSKCISSLFFRCMLA